MCQPLFCIRTPLLGWRESSQPKRRPRCVAGAAAGSHSSPRTACIAEHIELNQSNSRQAEDQRAVGGKSVCQACQTAIINVERPTMKAHRPYPSRLERALKRRDKLRRNWCRRCPFRAPSGRCLDTRIRSGRCGDWVYYLLPGGEQYRRRWVRPKDPRTPAQRQSRGRLGAASRKYSAGLPDRERAAWIAAGARRQSRPRLGQSGPLTGQQYFVQRENVLSTQGKVQCTKTPAKEPKPQRVTRPSSGTRRSITRVAPEQRESRWRVRGRGQKAVVGSEVQKQHRVTRSARGRYRSGSVVAFAPRARLMRRMGVRLMPMSRPAARPYAARGRAPGVRSGGGN